MSLKGIGNACWPFCAKRWPTATLRWLPHEEPGRCRAGLVSARHFHRRFARSACRLAPQGFAQSSPAVFTRPKAGWQEEFERWRWRALSVRRSGYIWADGVYLRARIQQVNVYRERQALTWQCVLVLIGATPERTKKLIRFQVGYRESAQSWRKLLADRKARGLTVPPELAIWDGALGFWKASEQSPVPSGSTAGCGHRGSIVINQCIAYDIPSLKRRVLWRFDLMLMLRPSSKH